MIEFNELTKFEKFLLFVGFLILIILGICANIHINPCKGKEPIYVETPNDAYSLYFVPKPIIFNRELMCIYVGLAVPNYFHQKF